MMVRLYRPGDAIQLLIEQVYALGAAQLLLEHPDFDPTRAWVAETEGQIRGFACCTGTFLACAVGAYEELLDVVHQDAGLREYGSLKVSYFCPFACLGSFPTARVRSTTICPAYPSMRRCFRCCRIWAGR